MAAEDKTIVCVDCKQEFVHTAEDQARYAERGFTNEPKRCRPCREARKAKQGAAGGSGGGGGGGGQAPAPRPPRQPIGGGMGGGPRRDFGGGGGGRGFGGGGPRRDFGGGGGRGNFGDRPRGPRQMFPAVCAECGKQTEVPFKPSGDRPVLCRDCFRASRGG